MAKFTVTINSPFEDGHATERTIRTPLGGQMAYEFGTQYPTAQQIANYYAGEYCDSGTVKVVGAGQRGLVARRSVA